MGVMLQELLVMQQVAVKCEWQLIEKWISTDTAVIHTQASVIIKKKKSRSFLKRCFKLSGSLNSDPTATIDTQWTHNSLTSNLAAPLSYVLCCTSKPVITSGEKIYSFTFMKKLIIAIQI